MKHGSERTMIQDNSIEILDNDAQSRQELDRNFLHSGYQRRVYIANDPGFSWRRRPRKSHIPLTLVPIPVDPGACGRLTFLDLERRLRSVDMEAGHYYFIPPEVPYEIETSGRGVFEIYAPVTAPKLFDEEMLPRDFFDRLRESQASPPKSDT